MAAEDRRQRALIEWVMLVTLAALIVVIAVIC
jgi:hypothetical protein